MNLRCQKKCRKRYGSGRDRRGQIIDRVSIHREIKEESGLNVSINERPLTSFQTMRGTEPMILIYYLCDYVSGDVALSKEHDAYKWANFQEFKTLCSFNELIEIVDYIFVK